MCRAFSTLLEVSPKWPQMGYMGQMAKVAKMARMDIWRVCPKYP